MMNFYDLIPFLRSCYAALFFMAVCGGIYLTCIVFARKSIVHKILLPLVILANAAVVLLYDAQLRSTRLDRVPSPASEWLCDLPVLFTALLLAATVVYYFTVVYDYWKYRQTTITRASIKEGIDRISSGLCFFYDGGRIFLMNNRMNELCHAIIGRDLQNAELFIKLLRCGEVLPEVLPIAYGDTPTFRLPDGSVWMFGYEKLDGVHQLVATDVTLLQDATDELREKNERLAVLNKRLRQYGENVDELARSKERLDIKVRIHRDLGQALLASRRYLQDETGKHPSPLDLWQKSIAMLRKEAEYREHEQPIMLLTRAAEALGVVIKISGDVPNDETMQTYFVQIAAEALTNAIRHAGAKTLYVNLSQTAEVVTAEFRNDGEPPRGRIVEGGGLGNLRSKIEGEGGKMTIAGDHEFILTVTLPKKRGNII